MKYRPLIRIVFYLCLLLCCAGVGVVSFSKLKAIDRRMDFNLYTLVPADAVAVLDAGSMAEWLSVAALPDSLADSLMLCVPDVMAGLKLRMAADEKDLLRMFDKLAGRQSLISFHQRDSMLATVAYCMWSDAGRSLERLMDAFTATMYSPKRFEYGGESLYICPMADGRFVTVFFSDDFVVASMRKQLVERVVDAYHRGCPFAVSASSGRDAGRTLPMSARLYVRVPFLEREWRARMANRPDDDWLELDMTQGEDTVYSSSILMYPDTLPATLFSADH